jgi:hypothetical protein
MPRRLCRRRERGSGAERLNDEVTRRSGLLVAQAKARALALEAPPTAAACAALDSAAQAEIYQTTAHLDEAIRRADRAALERLVAPSFEQVLGNGERLARAGFITALTSGGPMKFSVDSLRLCGWAGTAVVTFNTVFTVTEGAHSRSVSTFIVDIYQRNDQYKEGGQSPPWLLSFEQIGVRR